MTSPEFEGVLVKLDKLRDRIRSSKTTDPRDQQSTRLLIRALTETVVRLRAGQGTASRKDSLDVPDAYQADWQELVDALQKKGIRGA